tara:strand:+ start:2564 stop:3325 length:762 start_codon:yes stop_codon:yes gene_type:complete
MKFDFKKLDYEFDLNGYVVLKKIIPENIIKKANEKLKLYENLNQKNLPQNVYFGKGYDAKDVYISNILEADKTFEHFATEKNILKLLSRFTLNFFRLNHTVAMIKRSKGAYTYLHMGNVPHHPKVFYIYKDGKIFSNITKVVFPLCNNKENDGGFAAIPGSHKSNFSRPFDNNPKKNYLLKHINADPGDAIFFTEALAHGSLVNNTGKTRRILSYCYSVKYMPDWTKFKLSYSNNYLKTAPKKIKKLISLKKD